MIAHVTPSEVATLAAVFVAGLVVGAAALMRFLGRRSRS